MKIPTQLNLTVDLEEIAESVNDYDEAMHLIIAIDRNMADYEFTAELVKTLVESLKKEHTDDDPFDLNEILK